MFKKTIYLCLIALAVFTATTFTAAAQTVQLRGKVMMNGAPVKGAIVDVFRQDLPGNYTDLKTDNSGIFQHAGLPLIGQYIISVSAPGATPQARGPMRIQNTEFVVELTSGDGKRFTRDEAKEWAGKSAPKGNTTQAESADAKKAREEFEKKKAEVDAANKKATDSNAIYDKSLKEGNEAFAAKNYELSASKYDEALTYDSTHPSAPVLFSNKSIALRLLGIEKYNKSVKMSEGPEKTDGMTAGRQDIKNAADAASKAVEMLKVASAETQAQASYKTNLNNAIAARAEALRLVVKMGDASQAETAYSAFQEYIAIEIDPVKKEQAQMSSADLLFSAGKLDQALEVYRKIIETDPNNYDAYRGAGVVLFSLGYETKNKDQLQEAANYLQLFVDKSPDTLQEKAEAKSILDNLKNEEKIKAQKVTVPTKKKGN